MVSSETNGILLQHKSLKSGPRVVCLKKKKNSPGKKQALILSSKTLQPWYKQRLNGVTRRERGRGERGEGRVWREVGVEGEEKKFIKKSRF